jgi:hypothetical protein
LELSPIAYLNMLDRPREWRLSTSNARDLQGRPAHYPAYTTSINYMPVVTVTPACLACWWKRRALSQLQDGDGDSNVPRLPVGALD